MHAKNHLKALALTLLFAAGTATAAPDYRYSLHDSTGSTVTQADFAGKYQLIAFGFTHCPDVCPTTLYDFKQVLAKIPEPERLQPIFISIDPGRDTAQKLQDYIAYFDKRIIALRGSRQETDAAAASFGASYGYQIDGKKVNADELPAGTDYSVYHSTLIYLLNPQGKFIDVFDYQSGADNLREDIEAAIQADSQP